MLDRYTWGNAERVSPEAPVLVLRADTCEARLGGAASVAALLRGLDAQVTLAGVVGDDADGRLLRELLDQFFRQFGFAVVHAADFADIGRLDRVRATIDGAR